jgi:hypothetical protein
MDGTLAVDMKKARGCGMQLLRAQPTAEHGSACLQLSLAVLQRHLLYAPAPSPAAAGGCAEFVAAMLMPESRQGLHIHTASSVHCQCTSWSAVLSFLLTAEGRAAAVASVHVERHFGVNSRRGLGQY